MAIFESQELSYCLQEKQLLGDVTWSLEADQCVAIVGESGAGKSTFLRCLKGLINPTSGHLYFNGAPLPHHDKKAMMAFRQQIGMIFQNPCLLETQSVFENVALPLRLQHIPHKNIAERVTEALAAVGLADKTNASPKDLSGGQKQRVAIAKALVKKPKVLLCDEPTSALDAQTASDILNLIETLHKTHRIPVVIISHDLKAVQQMASHIAIFHQGTLVETGPIDTVLMQPSAPQTGAWLASYFKPNLSDSLKKQLANQPVTLLHLRFYQSTTFQPVLAKMMAEFNIQITILQARIETFHTTVIGTMVIGLMEPHPPLATLLAYLHEHTIVAQAYQEEAS